MCALPFLGVQWAGRGGLCTGRGVGRELPWDLILPTCTLCRGQSTVSGGWTVSLVPKLCLFHMGKKPVSIV